MQSLYSTASTDWATRHSLGWGLSLLQRYSYCIIKPQLTGPLDTRWGWVLAFCRDAVGVFYSLSWLGHETLVGVGCSLLQMQSVYSTPTADWATEYSLGWGLSLLQRCSCCILQPQLTGPQDTRWGWVLVFCRDAVVVLYSPRRLGLAGGFKISQYPSLIIIIKTC